MVRRLRHCEDGLPFPKPGTKVIVKARTGRFDVGKEVYVTDYYGLNPNTRDSPETDGIIVYDEPGGSDSKGNGYYLTEWEEEIDMDNPLDNLTYEQRQTITDLVLDAAEGRGYCNETKNILGALGMPTERAKKEYTIKVRLTDTPENLGHNFAVYADGKPIAWEYVPDTHSDEVPWRLPDFETRD